MPPPSLGRGFLDAPYLLVGADSVRPYAKGASGKPRPTTSPGVGPPIPPKSPPNETILSRKAQQGLGLEVSYNFRPRSPRL